MQSLHCDLRSGVYNIEVDKAYSFTELGFLKKKFGYLNQLFASFGVINMLLLKSPELLKFFILIYCPHRVIVYYLCSLVKLRDRHIWSSKKF